MSDDLTPPLHTNEPGNRDALIEAEQAGRTRVAIAVGSTAAAPRFLGRREIGLVPQA